MTTPKTYLRKIIKVYTYWRDDKCSKCGGETKDIFKESEQRHSYECLKCGHKMFPNVAASYLIEIEKLAKEGLKIK